MKNFEVVLFVLGMVSLVITMVRFTIWKKWTCRDFRTPKRLIGISTLPLVMLLTCLVGIENPLWLASLFGMIAVFLISVVTQDRMECSGVAFGAVNKVKKIFFLEAMTMLLFWGSFACSHLYFAIGIALGIIYFSFRLKKAYEDEKLRFKTWQEKPRHGYRL